MSDIKARIRQTTYETKENIIYNRVLPFFKNKKIETNFLTKLVSKRKNKDI